MSHLLESMNRELALELYEAKRQLRILEQRQVTLNSRQSQEIQVNFELSQMKIMLRNAEDRIIVQDSIINDFQNVLNQLHLENVYLARQNEMLLLQSEPKIEKILDFSLMDTAPSLLLPPTIAKEEAPKTNTDANTSSEEKKKKNDLASIAKKLNLSESAKNPSPSSKSESPSPSEMRLFVGHLCATIDENVLKNYFSTYGEVVDVFFPCDSSGKSRGFAFVSFSRMYGEHPLKTRRHVIEGREIYLDVSQYKHDESEPTQTVLASGIIHDSTDDTIIKHFSKYGKVLTIIRAKESRRKFSRWAFVHFEDCKSAERALADPIHAIDGHSLDLRRARDFQYYRKKESDHENAIKHEYVSRVCAMSTNVPSQNQVAPRITSDKNQAVNVRKLLIHNLEFRTTTETIRKYFSKFGNVIDAYIPTHYGTSDSKGFGYIVMPANEANFNYNSHVIDGRLVHISKEGLQNNTEKTSTILVSAGPEVMAKVNEEDLKNFFGRFGKIASVRKPADSFSKKCSHYAFVEFTSHDAVEKALAHMAYKINGQIVCITKSRFDPHK